MVDSELLQRKLLELETFLAQVSEYRALTLEQYRADWKIQRIVERTLHMAIETCIDVAGHALADRGLGAPTTYAESFTLLGQHGLLPRELAESLARMTGFRNILVHEYTAVDANVVLRILRKDLGDLEHFHAAARAWAS